MTDLGPGDIKDPEEEPLPPDDEDEEEKEEEKKDTPGKEPDLAAVAQHLVVAVAELARASGSPPAVTAALELARRALAK